MSRAFLSRMLDFPIGFSELACIFSDDQLNYPTGGCISLSCKWFLRNHESDPDVPVLYTRSVCRTRAWEKDTGMSTRPSIFSPRISILCFASAHFPFPATARILILRRHIGTWLPGKRLLFKWRALQKFFLLILIIPNSLMVSVKSLQWNFKYWLNVFLFYPLIEMDFDEGRWEVL